MEVMARHGMQPMAYAKNWRRIFFALVLLLVLTGAVSVGAHQKTFAPSSYAPPGYRLAWADEFNGNAYAADRWRPRTGTRLWSRQLLENIAVGGGILSLKGDRTLDATVNYSGAGLISRQAFGPGYYEARLKVPVGAGWHTSFWMMAGWSRSETGEELPVQEVDVIENDSLKPTRYYATVHRWKPEPHLALRGEAIHSLDLSKDFHVFGCEITSDLATFSLDGRVERTYEMASIPQSDVHIWLSMIAA